MASSRVRRTWTPSMSSVPGRRRAEAPVASTRLSNPISPGPSSPSTATRRVPRSSPVARTPEPQIEVEVLRGRRQGRASRPPTPATAPASRAAACRTGCDGRRRAPRSRPVCPSRRRVRAACIPARDAPTTTVVWEESTVGVRWRERRGSTPEGLISPRRSRWPASGSAARPPRAWPGSDSGGFSWST